MKKTIKGLSTVILIAVLAILPMRANAAVEDLQMYEFDDFLMGLPKGMVYHEISDDEGAYIAEDLKLIFTVDSFDIDKDFDAAEYFYNVVVEELGVEPNEDNSFTAQDNETGAEMMFAIGDYEGSTILIGIYPDYVNNICNQICFISANNDVDTLFDCISTFKSL